MTKEDILKNCTWDRYDMATLDIEIPILKAAVSVNLIPPLKLGRIITDDMAKAMNDVINLNINQLAEIKDYLFWYFNLCCEKTVFGFDIDFAEGETNTDGNKRYFAVKNEDDVLEKSKLEVVIIEGLTNSATITLNFEVPWDDEHGCEIEIINGEIVK